MKKSKYILKTPWDTKIFGINTYELRVITEKILKQVIKIPGHFTVKIDPLSSQKKLLHKYGFYYCDTLIQPYCSQDSFVYFKHKQAKISYDISINELTKISHRAFCYGRFHRDFNLDKNLADLRYDIWLRELYNSKNAFALIFNKKLAGFFGFSGNKIVLHAIADKYRSKGLAKYLWSVACKELFSKGHKELVSSISASNLSAVNLYVSLGFRLRNALDVYHLLVR